MAAATTTNVVKILSARSSAMAAAVFESYGAALIGPRIGPGTPAETGCR
tara:strand:- start:1194 stop:1340 length:147 start_codon:yes stop_codon:yes gene_type:complete